MSEELLCPMRKQFHTTGEGFEHGRALDGDGGEMFAPCLRARCAWWCWSSSTKDDGECALVGIQVIAGQIANGACQSGG